MILFFAVNNDGKSPRRRSDATFSYKSNLMLSTQSPSMPIWMCNFAEDYLVTKCPKRVGMSCVGDKLFRGQVFRGEIFSRRVAPAQKDSCLSSVRHFFNDPISHSLTKFGFYCQYTTWPLSSLCINIEIWLPRPRDN